MKHKPIVTSLEMRLKYLYRKQYGWKNTMEIPNLRVMYIFQYAIFNHGKREGHCGPSPRDY